MAFQPVDAAQCFTFISENLPAWIARVFKLAEYTVARNAEFAEEYRRLAPLKQRRRRNSSVPSVRPTSRQLHDVSPPSEDIVAIQETTGNENDHNGARADPKSNPLKRTNDEVSSSISGMVPPTVRIRHNLVIHFDGHTQHELEQVVRDIGVARNYIRKGRMSRLSKLSSRHMTFMKRAAAPLPFSANGSRDFTQTNPFDFVDKELELAQSLCESAAHQFLRNGSCLTELENVQEKFKSSLEVAITSAARFKQEKQEQEEQNSTESHREPELVSPLGKMETSLDSQKTPEATMATLEIEVDDNASDGSIAIDITAFRSARMRL